MSHWRLKANRAHEVFPRMIPVCCPAVGMFVVEHAGVETPGAGESLGN